MPTRKFLAKNVGVVREFLTPEECEAYIQFSEEQGYEEAAVTTEDGMVMMKDLRNNDRVIVDDENRADALWKRVGHFLPQKFAKKWKAVGLNERLRFYRYDPGQQFDWHLDGYYERADGDRSQFTFMIYLNEDFEGGETSFRGSGYGSEALSQNLCIVPETGKVLFFHHPIPHKGEPVTSGRKYVLRTDVMYARRNRIDRSASGT